MSTSTPFSERNDDLSPDGPSDSGPLKYAPKRPRLPKADPERELTGVNAAPASEPTEWPAPPWRRKNQPGAFVGDLDIVELRSLLGRSDRIPEPPLPDPPRSRLTAAWRVTIIMGTAAGIAAGAIGYRGRPVPPTPAAQQQPASNGAHIVDVAALAALPPVESPAPTNRPDNQPDAQVAAAGFAL